jgi:hypothetical protein
MLAKRTAGSPLLARITQDFTGTLPEALQRDGYAWPFA